MPQLIEPEPFTWVRYPLYRRLRFGKELAELTRALTRESTSLPRHPLPADAPSTLHAPDDAGERPDPALVAEARGRVFTSELRDLTDRVLVGATPRAPETEPEESPPAGPETELPSEFRALRWMRPALPPHPDMVTRWLHAVYAGRADVTSFDPAVTDHLLAVAGADSFALLLPEADEFLYRVAAHHGLDSTSAANLTFALNDEYLTRSQPEGVLHLHDFDDDFFFKKRFGTIFFQGHQSMLLLSLQPLGETGFLAFFYESRETPDPVRVRSDLEAFLADLAPVLRRHRLRAESGANLMRRVYQQMRRLTDGGKHPVSVIHMSVVDMPEGASARHAVRDAADQVRSLLAPSERLLLVPANRMIVLCTQTDEQSIVDRLHQTAAHGGYRIAVSCRRYPDAGRNLLNYVQMP